MFLFFITQSLCWELPTYPSNFYAGFNGWVKVQGKIGKMVDNKTIFGFPVVANFNASHYLIDMLEPYKGTVKSLGDFNSFFSDFQADVSDKIQYVQDYVSDTKQLTGLIVGAAFAIIILIIFLILVLLLFLFYIFTCCCCKPKESSMPNWCSKGCMLVASALYLLAGICFFFIISPVRSTYNTALHLEDAYATVYPEVNSSLITPFSNNINSLLDDIVSYIDEVPDDIKYFVKTIVNGLKNGYNNVVSTVTNSENYDPATNSNPQNLFDALELLKYHVQKYNNDSKEICRVESSIPKLDFTEQIQSVKDHINDALKSMNDSIRQLNDTGSTISDPLVDQLDQIKDMKLNDSIKEYTNMADGVSTLNILLLQLGVNPNMTELIEIAKTIKYPVYSIIGLGAGAFLILVASTWCIFCGHSKCSRCQASCCPCCHLFSGFLAYLVLGLVSFVVAYVCVIVHETVLSFDTVINYVPDLTQNGTLEFSFSQDVKVNDVSITISIDPIVVDLTKIKGSLMDTILHSDKSDSSLMSVIDIQKILNTDHLLERCANISNWFNNTIYEGIASVFSDAIEPAKKQLPDNITKNENYPKNIGEEVENANKKIEENQKIPNATKQQLITDLNNIRNDIETVLPAKYQNTYHAAIENIFDKYSSNFLATWNGELFPSLERFLNATTNLTSGAVNHLVDAFKGAKLAPISKLAALFGTIVTYNTSYALSAIFFMCQFGAAAVFISSLLIYIRRKGMMNPDAVSSSYDESSSYDYDKSSSSGGKMNKTSSDYSSSDRKASSSSSSSFSSSSSSGGNARRKRRYS